ncbi:MAG: hypothetical protein AAGA25_03500 [Planctomycetota bacterium]
MTHAPNTAGSIAAQQAAIAQALRASGVITKMSPDEFLRMVDINDEPLVVHAHHKGVFKKYHQYLTSYRGLAFYARVDDPVDLPHHAQVVEAESIWIP